MPDIATLSATASAKIAEAASRIAAPTPTDPVTAAFDALIARLSEHALGEDFDRGVRFRTAAVSLRDRWAAGRMPRASTKKEAT